MIQSLYAAYRFQGAVSFVGTRLCCLGYDHPNGGGPLMTPEEFRNLYRVVMGKEL